jgi:ribonuclease BN (tRNA processing enzyme)
MNPSVRLKELPHLIIIGSGTGIPSLRRGSPGLLLVSDQSITLIDSGPGALRKMLEVGVTYSDIDLLLYTHIHPDHVSDLVPILFASKYGELPRKKDLLCIGGHGFRRYLQKLRRIYGSWIEPQSYQLEVKETSQRPFHFNDLKIFPKPMAHLPESVGYRFEFKNGKSMAVSGDTDYCRNMVDLARGVDLLVLECSFPDGKKIEGHLTPSLAGTIASESRCKRLLLVHLYPICDEFDILKECKRVYQGEVILAEDLMKIRI